MMRASLSFLIFCLITFILGELISCKDTQEPTSEIVFPDSNISFSKHVGPLFQQKCARGGCHTGSDPAGSLNLGYPGSYIALTNHNPTLIYNGDGQNSLLMKRLDGRIQPRMPLPGSAQLTQNQIDGVKIWIDEGAQDN
jgi:hypothetical protein